MMQGAWQGSHKRTNVSVTDMNQPRKARVDVMPPALEVYASPLGQQGKIMSENQLTKGHWNSLVTWSTNPWQNTWHFQKFPETGKSVLFKCLNNIVSSFTHFHRTVQIHAVIRSLWIFFFQEYRPLNDQIIIPICDKEPLDKQLSLTISGAPQGIKQHCKLGVQLHKHYL